MPRIRALSLSASESSHLDVPGYFARTNPLITELMFDRNYRLLSAIVETDPEYNFGGNPLLQKHIINLTQAHGTFQPILRFFFVKEIQQTIEPCTLFRGASIATAIFAGQFHEYESQYIRRLTLPLVSAIVSSEREWKINPQLEPDKSVTEQNAEDIKILTTVFLDRIFDNERPLPVSLTANMSFINGQIKDKFGNEAEDVIPAFFFLRFLCPVIVTPERFGILSNPPASRRGLILVTKILQRLASKEEFTADKESYMCEFNVIIQSYADKFATFSKLLTNANTDIPKFSLPAATDDAEAISFFTNTIEDQLPDIKEKLKDDLDLLKFLNENFDNNPTNRKDSLDPTKLNKSTPDNAKTKLLDKARKRMFRKSQTISQSSQETSDTANPETPSIDYSGQLVVLKELLREESRSRQQMEEALAVAQKQLAELQIKEQQCNCN